MNDDFIVAGIAMLIVFLIVGGLWWAIYLDEVEENNEKRYDSSRKTYHYGDAVLGADE